MVKKINPAQIAILKNQLDTNNPTSVGSFAVVSQDPLLSDMVTGSEKMIRGPIGIDVDASGKIWVTVDTGTRKPGKIVTIDPSDNAELYLDNIQGPRDLFVN